MCPDGRSQVRKYDPLRLGVQFCVPLLVFLVGCAGLFPGSFEALESENGRQVLDALRLKEKEVASLRGLFRADISGAGLPLSQSLNGMFSYARPDSVRLKGFARLGLPFLDFRRKGEEYSLNFPQEGKHIHGKLDELRSSNQWDNTVRLSLQALDAVLNKMEEVDPSSIQVWRSEDQFRIDMSLSGTHMALEQDVVLVRRWVDFNTLEIQSIEYFSSFDELIVLVECKDYREIKDKKTQTLSPVRLPFSVQATDHRPAGGSISMKVQEYVLNAG